MEPEIIYHEITNEAPELNQQRLNKAFRVLFTEVDRKLKLQAQTASIWLLVIPNIALTVIDNKEYT